MKSKLSESQFDQILKAKQISRESLCSQCGGCCGAYDDPCQHLRKTKNDKYYCSIYDNRFGTHKTLSGDEFDCVWVREVIDNYWANDHLCTYKKIMKSPWLKEELLGDR